jgi:hypothetical protein
MIHPESDRLPTKPSTPTTQRKKKPPKPPLPASGDPIPPILTPHPTTTTDKVAVGEFRLRSVKVGFEQDFTQYGQVSTGDGMLDRGLARDIKSEITEFFLGLGAKYGFEVHARCVEL